MTERQKAMAILTEVCRHYDVSVHDVMGKCRRGEYIFPRHFAMYYVRQYTSLSLSEIGRMVGKDHATVLHSIRTVNDLIEMNGYRTTATQIKKRIVTRLLGSLKIARDRRLRNHYRAMLHRARQCRRMLYYQSI